MGRTAAVAFETTPPWTSVCTQRLRPLGKPVMRMCGVIPMRGCPRSLLPKPRLHLNKRESAAFCGRRRRRRKPIGSTNCLSEAACGPARQAFALRSVGTWMTTQGARFVSVTFRKRHVLKCHVSYAPRFASVPFRKCHVSKAARFVIVTFRKCHGS